MDIFFDMDYTLLAIDGDLRPGAKETFQQLKEDGHRLHIWSGIGVRRSEVQRLGLDIYVDGVYEKPVQDYQRQLDAMVRRQEIPTHPDLVVDDYPEIVSALGGIVVRPYFHSDVNDKEMERVYQIIHEYRTNGHSQDAAFRPRREDSEP